MATFDELMAMTKADLAALVPADATLGSRATKEQMAEAILKANGSEPSGEPTREEIAAVNLDALAVEDLLDFARFLQNKVSASEPLAPSAPDAAPVASVTNIMARTLIIQEPAGRGHCFNWHDDGAETVTIRKLPEMEWGYLEFHADEPLIVNDAELVEVRVAPAA